MTQRLRPGEGKDDDRGEDSAGGRVRCALAPFNVFDANGVLGAKATSDGPALGAWLPPRTPCSWRRREEEDASVDLQCVAKRKSDE